MDLKTATLTTSFDWTAPSGHVTSFTYVVNANQTAGHLGTVNLTVVPHWSGTASVVDAFDGRGLNHATAQPASVDRAKATLSQAVVTDGGLVTAALSSVLQINNAVVPTAATGAAGQAVSFAVQAEKSYQITKFVGIASSVDNDRTLTAATPQQAAASAASTAATAGYAQAISQNAGSWATLWASDITVPGDTTTTTQIHAAMFYLLESLRPGVTWSSSPGGLSSDSYYGGVFWDMETWMYPALLAQHPEIAVGADTYRQKLLPAAQAIAASLSTSSHPIAGAKYPWISGLSGAEVTSPTIPQGKDEIHINSDIALAQWQYYQATGDQTWLRNDAWPVLSNIADYWASRATAAGDGSYDIDDVMGPDEYHDGVNDSVTTNAGAQASLRIADQAAAVIGVAPDPLWKTVADALKIPLDSATGIHPEFTGYTGDTIKQADVTLLQYPWNLPMSTSTAQNDLDYYAQRTSTAGPSMTDAIASIADSQLGSAGCASYTYLQRSVNPFLAAPFDQFHESRSGGAFTFTTGEGGFLQEFLYGFTGLRLGTSSVAVNPALPPQVPGVDLTGLHWQGRTFDLSVAPATTTLTLRSGAALPVTVAGGAVQTVQSGTPLQIATRSPAAISTTDLARCASVSASSADPSYPPVAAIDGADGTWWQPTTTGASLTVDLGASKAVTTFKVVAPVSTTAYGVQISTDGTQWTTVVTQGTASAATTTHTVSGVSARYVRYVAAAGTTPKVAAFVVSG